MNRTALVQIDPPKILAIHQRPTRVKDGEVVGVVPGTAIVPVVELDQPEHDHRTHQCRRLDPVAHADRVEIGWELSQRSNESIVSSIKSKAGEVITGRFSLTKQLNFLAEAQLLQTLEQTPEVSARLAELRSNYMWIRAVRDKSNELESALLEQGEIPGFDALEVPVE